MKLSKGEETRKYIVERASELFNTKGFDGTSMSDVMKATGLKKGGLYNHFRSKEEIALASFDYMFAIIFNLFRRHLDSAKNSTQKIIAIMTAMEELIVNSPVKGGCPIGNAAVYANDDHPLLKNRSQKAFEQLIDYVAIKIKEGIQNKEFNNINNYQSEALLLVCSLEGAVLMTRVSGSIQTFHIVRSKIVDRIKEW